jgi:hypothetical protein
MFANMLLLLQSEAGDRAPVQTSSINGPERGGFSSSAISYPSQWG